jgi:hypothetical protein
MTLFLSAILSTLEKKARKKEEREERRKEERKERKSGRGRDFPRSSSIRRSYVCIAIQRLKRSRTLIVVDNVVPPSPFGAGLLPLRLLVGGVRIQFEAICSETKSVRIASQFKTRLQLLFGCASHGRMRFRCHFPCQKLISLLQTAFHRRLQGNEVSRLKMTSKTHLTGKRTLKTQV